VDGTREGESLPPGLRPCGFSPTPFLRTRKLFRVFRVLCGVALFVGCSEISANLNGREKFGDDYAYFAALKALREKDESEAKRMFALGAKKAGGIVKRKCAEELTRLGSVPERVGAARNLVAEYDDDAAFLRAAEELSAAREYRELIALTDSHDARDSELLRYRMSALAEKKDPRLAEELQTWLSEFPVSESQRAFIKTYGVPDGVDTRLFSARESVFLRRYDEAFGKLSDILGAEENPATFIAHLPASALSDIGKIFVYGDGEYVKNALVLERAASEMKEKKLCAFYPFFYAGRLYDRSGGKNGLIALDRFQKAMNEASGGEDPDALYDNALWYYLSCAQKISLDDATEALEQFGATFRDKAYYNDFFDTLALALLSAKQWDTFRLLAQTVERIADGDARSKYCYLAGRLVDAKLARGTKSDADEWFRKALEPGGNIYYMLLASRALGISGAEFERAVFSRPAGKSSGAGENSAPDDSADKLLLGYAAHGFPERVYGGWFAYRDSVSAETVITLAEFLQNCADETLRIQGLRMMSRTVMNGAVFTNPSASARALPLMFPRFFEREITDVSREFDIPDAYIYALARSESFFDPNVSSHAGARGLTQLMDSTAADIAKKLKTTDYDIFDSATNLRFGAYYLAELLDRLGGNILAAYFAYNAGISRVRTWLGAAKNVPADIFLETIPFAETREYGKNVVTAMCFYGKLYDDTPVNATLDAVFGRPE
jgi:soluble lytic murein transglycosylase